MMLGDFIVADKEAQKEESMLTFEASPVQGVGNIVEKLKVRTSSIWLGEDIGDMGMKY